MFVEYLMAILDFANIVLSTSYHMYNVVKYIAFIPSFCICPASCDIYGLFVGNLLYNYLSDVDVNSLLTWLPVCDVVHIKFG